MKKNYALVLFLILVGHLCFAQKGKDGAKIIAINNSIVNEYTTLTSDAAMGNTSIIVSDNSLNTNGRFGGPLAVGDLIMIIQMQGATIDGTPTDTTWGGITGYNNCGSYELDEVASVTGSTAIDIECPLKNNYTQTGKVQIIRIPRYSSLTINSGDTLICDKWDGAKGGVLAVEVLGNTVINGAINTTAMGFRGGAHNVGGGTQRVFDFASTNFTDGGDKGESIAGYQSDYNPYGGEYDRGAPANGGGGGDAWNSAGGGGANAGDINTWTGMGNPDHITNAAWDSAWNLEYNGFAFSVSSGGGRGGYVVAEIQQDPYLIGPDTVIWDGLFYRDNVGGLGGRPLDYSTGRLFLGGGGGAGHDDNGFGGGGGNGGGLIYVVSYGTVSGSGAVISNGQHGGDNNSSGSIFDSGDGMGGGGGGGTIILNSFTTISGINAFANGGSGGNQYIWPTRGEAEGPGAGGGGGYISTSNAIPAQVSGGINGTTDCFIMVKFPPDGATIGGDGIATVTCLPQLSAINGPIVVCAGNTYTYSVSPTCGTPAFTWILPAGWTGTSTTNSITVTTGATGGTISVSINSVSCPPAPLQDTTLLVTVFPAPVNPNFSPDTSICGVVNFQLSAHSNTFNYLWSTGETTPVINVTDTGLYKVWVYNDCDTLKDSINVIQEHLPKVFIGNDTVYCDNFSRVLDAGDSVTSYKWSTGAITQTITVSLDGTYWVTVTNDCGTATDSITFRGCKGGYIVPNAFTPGESGINNLLSLLKTGDGEVALEYFNIYNRWGQLIFSTHDENTSWDGRFNGINEPIGVYVYVVRYVDQLGVNKLLKGNITLLR